MPYPYHRKTIFSTFFLSLLSGILICISFVTNHWIESRPWRVPNPSESSGYVHLGLLHGKKVLNVAFGWRPYEITISELIDKNPELLSRNLWYITLLSTCLSLICAGLSAFLAIIYSASGPQLKVFSVCSIFCVNTIAFILCSTSSCSWYIQYYTKLSNNILSKEDLDNFWTSKGATTMGFSFWLIVIAGIFHLINILIIALSLNSNRRSKQKPSQLFEEKSVGAIMLY